MDRAGVLTDARVPGRVVVATHGLERGLCRLDRKSGGVFEEGRATKGSLQGHHLRADPRNHAFGQGF
eukprot:10426962-Lingulodinium_polyedra.AAC.1